MKPTVEAIVLTSIQGSEFLGSETDILKQSRRTGMLWGQPAPKFMKASKKVLYKHAELTAFINSLDEFKSNAHAGGR